MNDTDPMSDKRVHNPIKLYYFSTHRNFGDALNIDILEYSGAEYCCVDPNEANLVAIGSILHNIITDEKPARHAYHEYIDIWGSGFIKSSDREQEYFIKKVNIHALRGKLSKARCEAILGLKLDGIALGDPGLLASRAVAVGDVEKKYDVGIIPHYVDKNSDLLSKIQLKHRSCRIIDVQGDVYQTCKEICECRMVLSSAMHGLVAADSYGVPNQWLRFSDDIIGGDYKFNDYYSAFDIEGMKPVDLRQETISDQDIDRFISDYPISRDAVEDICDTLEKAFPRRSVLDLPMSAAYSNTIESERNESREKNKQAIHYYDLAERHLYGGDFKEAEENISKYRSLIDYDSFPKYDGRFLKSPELSVIIVAYQTGDMLVDCIESLINNNDGYYEMIIVDNGGNEKVVEKLLGFPLLYVSSPHNFKPSEGRNIGAYFAKGRILSFLDDDAIVGKDYTKNIMQSFGRDNIIALRGKVLPKTIHCMNEKAGHYDLGKICKFIRYVNAEGNCAFSKDEYVKLDGMNPLLFGHEGIELSYRLEKSHSVNKILYSPEIVIYHDFADTDLKHDIKVKRHHVMMSYLEFMNPDIKDFIADIDYSNSGVQGSANISFSIIMATYNRKHCINNAINSLLAQTYKNFELIIIDAGSTDGTEKYLNDIYQEEIRREKIIFVRLPENQGVSFARNEGLRRARYDWIGYLDTDNQMHSHFLATYAEGILRNPTSEVFYAQIRHRQSQAVIGHEFDFDELVQFNFIDLGVFVHSRRIYGELGGFDTHLYRLIDWDFIINYTDKYPPKFIEEVLLDYDDNPALSRITNTVPIDDAYKKVILNYYERTPAQYFIEKHTGHIASLKQAITDRDQAVQALTQALAERESQISARDAQIANLNLSAVEQGCRMTEILSSTSWKITWPLRIVGQQLKRFLRAVELAGPAIQRGGGLKNTIAKAIRVYRREGMPGIKRGFRMAAVSAAHRIPLHAAHTDESLARMKRQIEHLARKPLISVVMPAYNTRPEWLAEAIESVRRQIYPYWELCIADGGSEKETTDCLLHWQKLDERVHVIFLEENKGIAGNSIDAFALTHGDYIVMLDHDDYLTSDALMELAFCINKNSDVDFIYSDRAVFSDETKEILAYHCLPGFSPDFLRACNYASHLNAFSRFIIDEVGFLKRGYEGSQDYELELRVIERARRVLHIPKVLYFSRACQGSVALSPENKMYAYEAGRRAIEEHIKRIGYEGRVEFMKETYSYRIHYRIPGTPLISIIIPNKDHKQDLKKCIDSIISRSTYNNYEIIIAENNSETDDIFAYYDELKTTRNVKVIPYDRKEFNFSAINNHAAQAAAGEHILLLNNDTEVITPNWLEELLAFSQREDVGAVGAKLYYADGRIQHAGLVLGLQGSIASHYHHGDDRRSTGYMHRLMMPQNYCAVTGACLLVKKRLYLEVGGMDEVNFKIGLNDVDFCLKLLELGKINVWTPYAELYHYESVSRGPDTTPEKSARLKFESVFFREKWKLFFEQEDPYHNAGIAC